MIKSPKHELRSIQRPSVMVLWYYLCLLWKSLWVWDLLFLQKCFINAAHSADSTEFICGKLRCLRLETSSGVVFMAGIVKVPWFQFRFSGCFRDHAKKLKKSVFCYSIMYFILNGTALLLLIMLFFLSIPNAQPQDLILFKFWRIIIYH